MDKRIFVIGDIHGCFKTFRRLLFERLQINLNDEIYLLGDYIDRGPDSKAVIDLIIDLQNKSYKIFPIAGNHESMFLDAVSGKNLTSWLRSGAAKTFKSFKISSINQVPKEYFDFLNNLPYYIILDNFILVHGSLNFNSPEPFSDYQSMVWERVTFVDKSITEGRRLIVGHTPSTVFEIENSLSGDFIRLDGGCVYNYDFRYGYLAALEINKMNLYFQKNIE